MATLSIRPWSHSYVTRRVLEGLLGAFLILHSGLAESAPEASNTVAVLDFTNDGIADADAAWTMGAADFFEMNLQRAGISTLERRQVRLLLGERQLLRNGVLDAGSLQALSLPVVGFFVGGRIFVDGQGQPTLQVDLSQAISATMEASFNLTITNKADFAPVLQVAADDIARTMRDRHLTTGLRDTRKPMTWVPEAAVDFFAAFDQYAKGYPEEAALLFASAYERDTSFKLAALWQTRMYEQLGHPGLARKLAQQYGLGSQRSFQRILGTNTPTLAVVIAPGVLDEYRDRIYGKLGADPRFRVFSPEWISAASRELDLHIEDATSIALGQRTAWLLADYLLTVKSSPAPSNTTIQLLCQHLVSGATVHAGSCALVSGSSEAIDHLLADFLTGWGSEKTVSASSLSATHTLLTLPTADDTPRATYVKLLRWLRQWPHDVRALIAAGDAALDGVSAAYFRDRAIEEIGLDRSQPDASFLLASVLWRKEMAMTSPTTTHDYPTTQLYWTQLSNQFARLVAWFPESSDATNALNVRLAKRSGGTIWRVSERYMWALAVPEDERYLSDPVLASQKTHTRAKPKPAAQAEETGAITDHAPAADDAMVGLGPTNLASRLAKALQVLQHPKADSVLGVKVLSREVMGTILELLKTLHDKQEYDAARDLATAIRDYPLSWGGEDGKPRAFEVLNELGSKDMDDRRHTGVDYREPPLAEIESAYQPLLRSQFLNTRLTYLNRCCDLLRKHQQTERACRVAQEELAIEEREHPDFARQNREYWVACVNAATDLLSLKRYEECQRLCDRVFKASEAPAEVRLKGRLRSAEAYYECGQTGQALEILEKSDGLPCQRREYWETMASIAGEWFAKRRYDGSICLCERLGKAPEAPKDLRASACLSAAQAHRLCGRNEQALEQAKLAMTLGEGIGTDTEALTLIKQIRTTKGTDVVSCCGNIDVSRFEVATTNEAVEIRRLLKTVDNNGDSPEIGKLQRFGRKVIPFIILDLEAYATTNAVPEWNERWRLVGLVRLCGNLGPSSIDALPALARIAVQDIDSAPQEMACYALGRIGAPAGSAVPALIVCSLRGPTRGRNASWALSVVGAAPLRVLPVLVQLLQSDNPALRTKAAQAIVQTAKLQERMKGLSEEEIVAAVDEWWTKEGSSVSWDKRP